MNLEILNTIILFSLINLVGFLNFKRAKTLFCGIVAYSGIGPANPDKLSLLLYMNSEKRGGEGTGIYTKETGIVKSEKKAEEFLTKNPIEPSRLFIGHARRSSVGFKAEKNSHPFEFHSLVGVHNGTLENHWEMLRNSEFEYKMSDFDVDSQVLYQLLDDDVIMPADEFDFKTLTKFIGAAALVFTDKRYDNRLYAYRTSDRPLYYGMLGDNMYMSSLEEGLNVIGCKDNKQFLSNYLYIVEDGKVLSSKHYKQATKPPVNYGMANRTLNLLNKNKDQDYYDQIDDYEKEKGSTNSRIGDFVKNKLVNVAGMASTNSAELVDRWIQCSYDYINKAYGGKTISFTKDVWYQVTGYNVKNNFDIELIDDNGVTNYANKYIFNLLSLSFNSYVVATVNIADNKQNRIWTKGEIIEVIDPNIKNKSVELFHIQDDRSYMVDVKCIRQASRKEADDHLAQLLITKEDKEFADSYNRLLKANNAEDDEDDMPFQDTSPSNITDNVPDDDTPNDAEVIDDDDDDDAYVSSQTYDFVLAYISDEIKELKELTETIAWDELKEKVASIEKTVDQCKDVEYVESNME